MRPYIICHMTTSIDGKVTGDFLRSEECVPATEEYYRLNREIPAEAFACGRITMEESFTGGWYPDLSKYKNVKMNREDYIANQEASRYAVAFDRKGRLGWKSSKIEDADKDPGYDGAHIIEVLCENVSDTYLAYLQEIGVSYIFAGKDEMDLKLALKSYGATSSSMICFWKAAVKLMEHLNGKVLSMNLALYKHRLSQVRMVNQYLNQVHTKLIS